jgi:hypothetical protein
LRCGRTKALVLFHNCAGNLHNPRVRSTSHEATTAAAATQQQPITCGGPRKNKTPPHIVQRTPTTAIDRDRPAEVFPPKITSDLGGWPKLRLDMLPSHLVMTVIARAIAGRSSRDEVADRRCSIEVRRAAGQNAAKKRSVVSPSVARRCCCQRTGGSDMTNSERLRRPPRPRRPEIRRRRRCRCPPVPLRGKSSGAIMLLTTRN